MCMYINEDNLTTSKEVIPLKTVSELLEITNDITKPMHLSDHDAVVNNILCHRQTGPLEGC